jgi:glutathione S-transferase
VPLLTDGGLSNIASSAILLDLCERSEGRMPRGRSEVVMWVFAALNSVEMASVPWSVLRDAPRPGRVSSIAASDAG